MTSSRPGHCFNGTFACTCDDDDPDEEDDARRDQHPSARVIQIEEPRPHERDRRQEDRQQEQRVHDSAVDRPHRGHERVVIRAGQAGHHAGRERPERSASEREKDEAEGGEDVGEVHVLQSTHRATARVTRGRTMSAHPSAGRACGGRAPASASDGSKNTQRQSISSHCVRNLRSGPRRVTAACIASAARPERTSTRGSDAVTAGLPCAAMSESGPKSARRAKLRPPLTSRVRATLRAGGWRPPDRPRWGPERAASPISTSHRRNASGLWRRSIGRGAEPTAPSLRGG